MSLQRLTERTAAPFTGSKVNREAGTISNVLICGTASANGRDYPPAVFRRDFAKYENRPVNCDHGREATVERRFGWFSNVQPGPDGRPRGTLNCLKSHPMYERVMEAAERNPALFGFSHVAMCRTTLGAGGREVVEAIESVESIDLVAEPATTKGLFEGRNVNKISLKQFTERFGAKLGPNTWLGLKKMCEDYGAMADAPMMDEPAADAEPGDLKTALIAALAPFLEEAFDSGNADKACSALRDFVKTHAKHTGGKATGGEMPNEGSADEESKKRRAGAILEAMAVCKQIGFKGYEESDLDTIAGTPKDRREAVAESLKKIAASSTSTTTKVESSGRDRIDPKNAAGGGSGKVEEGRPPVKAKAFAEFMGISSSGNVIESRNTDPGDADDDADE